jgi:hypothetical protein
MAHKSAQPVYLKNVFAATHFEKTGSDNFERSLTLRFRFEFCAVAFNQTISTKLGSFWHSHMGSGRWSDVVESALWGQNARLSPECRAVS